MAEPLSLPPVPEPPKGERLKNKVVLLTGAAQGIGEAIVATFASQQAKLVISDIQGEKVENVAAQWRGKGADVVAIKADVSQQQDLQAMARLAVSPGDSMPNRLTRPGRPWSLGVWMKKSAAGSPGPPSFGRMPL
ncbi:rhamnulose-1-phosphate aldolase/alcohol dehydrogenase [compost metagenome]